MNEREEMNWSDFRLSTRTHYATEVEISQDLICVYAPDKNREGKAELGFLESRRGSHRGPVFKGAIQARAGIDSQMTRKARGGGLRKSFQICV